MYVNNTSLIKNKINNKKIIDYAMFIIYVTMATKILKRQLYYPKNVISKTVYLFSSKVHLYNSYKFKIIPIGFTSANNKEIYLVPSLHYHGNQCQLVSYRTKNSILEDDNFFFQKRCI